MRSSSETTWADELKTGWFGGATLPRYRLTRFVFLRALGFIYYVAYLTLATELPGLLGSRGILPVHPFLQRVEGALGFSEAFWQLPSLFWFAHTDLVLKLAAWLGVLLSLLVLAGFANAVLLAALWILYLSFVHVGQIFYGYGWEMLLLETGFLAIFWVPLWRARPTERDEASRVVVVLLRWLLFRLMFGAGLIKIRGDACWTDLTCLIHHYETQPNPHPLSWLLHQAPPWFHEMGVLFNHFVELIVPWGLFGPRRVRHLAGGFTAVFQVTLILSGNLSFLNWLTLVVAIACFDDGFWERVLPGRIVQRFRAPSARASASRSARGVRVGLAVVVALLSLNPVVNMLSPRQRMNASFDPFDIVNTYGAFGSVGKERYEVVIEGTTSRVPDEHAHWVQYEFPCKPGRPERAPCWVTPFHHRLDWQMWFAALSSYKQQPWILNLVHRLLEQEPAVLHLLANNPFPDQPPRFIRAILYHYRFTTFGEKGFWVRKPEAVYLPPLSMENPQFRRYLARFGWLDEPP